MPRHNIRPEVVPLIVEVLRESKQCKGVLSEGPGCYCFEGAVCEAYRRAHPGEAEWGPQGTFLEDGNENDLNATYAVYEWAVGRPLPLKFDDQYAVKLNDEGGKDFPWFIAALEAE